ncbi:MAG: endolytic transglycosylase MltG [bacterium]|nr:endolytic transglycosylase MltG [bacterium]
MKRIIAGMIAIGAALLLGIAVSAAADRGPKSLTTNIDFSKKTINDGAGDAEPSLLFSTLAEAFEDAVELMNALPSVANPSIEYVRVKPGMRKEEVAALLVRELGWDEEEKQKFLESEPIARAGVSGKEGVLYPGVYLVPDEADGEALRKLMTERFAEEVVARYASSTRKVIGLETALKIASLIEREAGGKRDMRLVSGVIWNRLFKEMSLGIDATLQYAKGTEKNWWPRVLPDDKYIKSPYNTYLNEGLPPTAISNVSLASLEAALNPKKTDYLFYLHDRYGRFYGAKTYREHLKNIERYLK